MLWVDGERIVNGEIEHNGLLALPELGKRSIDVPSGVIGSGIKASPWTRCGELPAGDNVQTRAEGSGRYQ
jgi:hypothetical protein